MNRLSFVLLLFLIVFFAQSCGNQNAVTAPQDLELTNDNSITALSKVGRTMVWVDCILFRSVVTPATFKPESDPFDQLYAAGFKDGIGLISESKPGDQDYNGGRWHLNVLKSSVDADKYADACQVEDLDLNDFESTENYFECPLQPIRGNR